MNVRTLNPRQPAERAFLNCLEPHVAARALLTRATESPIANGLAGSRIVWRRVVRPRRF
jgi:hypothetical protein